MLWKRLFFNYLIKYVTYGHFTKYYIYAMEDSGIIEGYGDGTFKPEKTVKTGEFIKMLAVLKLPNFEFTII